MILWTLTARVLGAATIMQDQQSPTGPVGGSPVAVVDEIRAVEHKRLRALVDGDIEVARSLHSDDFQWITPSGVAPTKESYRRWVLR